MKDAEAVCEKVNGQCTGESRLPWQDEKDHYTSICPAMLIREAAPALQIFNMYQEFGNSEGGGWLDEPALWTDIVNMVNGVIGAIHGRER